MKAKVQRFNQEDFNIQYSPSAVIYVNDERQNCENFKMNLEDIFFEENLKDEIENDLLNTRNPKVIDF